MHYLKCLFYNFLAIFFANHVLPGFTVTDPTRLPHLGGDLPFALALALLNSWTVPLLKLFRRGSVLHIAIATLILNFLVYGLIKILPIGVTWVSIEGYLLISILVSIVAFAIHCWEMRFARKPSEPISPPSNNEPPKPPL